MQITARWGEEAVAVEVEAECRTLAALKAVLQDALPEVDVGTVCLEVGGRELADDDVCGLEAGGVVSLSATVAALAAATLREEGWRVDFDGFRRAAADGDVRLCGLYLDAGVACIPGTNGFDPLHLASAYSHVEVVRLLLDRGAANAARRSGSDTPLHLACFNGNVDIATLLLDHGAAIDAKSSTGDTPLLEACRRTNIATVKLLLDRGAAIDARSSDGYTPLHAACFLRDDVALVTLLLDRGAAIDAKDGSGATPLTVACQCNYRAMIRLLLEHGAAVDAAAQEAIQQEGDSEMLAALARATGQVEATPCL